MISDTEDLQETAGIAKLGEGIRRPWQSLTPDFDDVVRRATRRRKRAMTWSIAVTTVALFAAAVMLSSQLRGDRDVNVATLQSRTTPLVKSPKSIMTTVQSIRESESRELEATIIANHCMPLRTVLVEETQSSIVLTAYLDESIGDCILGGKAVISTVLLSEPRGSRQVIDGLCLETSAGAMGDSSQAQKEVSHACEIPISGLSEE